MSPTKRAFQTIFIHEILSNKKKRNIFRILFVSLTLHIYNHFTLFLFFSTVVTTDFVIWFQKFNFQAFP